MQINPNRMELRKVKAKLKTAENGYSLLKDKTNEQIRLFYSLVQENKKLRMEVESEFGAVLKQFGRAKTRISEKDLGLLFAMPSYAFDCLFKTKQLLNSAVPDISVQESILDSNLPYSPIGSTTELDFAVQNFYKVVPKLVKLAESEKIVYLLASDIEKGKRRVNALENILLPRYRETIKNIELKLAENDRGNLTRLMKVKNMIIEDN